MPDRVSYTIHEAAEALGLSAETVRRLIARGELSSVRVGKRVLIPAESLHDLVAVQ